jgi:predicted nucleic acid-binding Zn ribbon protein
MAKRKRSVFCPNCGNTVKGADTFCSACGNNISKKLNRPQKSNRRQNWVWIIGLVLVVAFIGGFVAAGLSGNKQNVQSDVNRAHDTALVASVAAEFDCSCGNCDKKLQNCDCPTAKDTYFYITQQIDKETYSRLEVIRMVNDRYGHLINKAVLEG